MHRCVRYSLPLLDPSAWSSAHGYSCSTTASAGSSNSNFSLRLAACAVPSRRKMAECCAARHSTWWRISLAQLKLLNVI